MIYQLSQLKREDLFISIFQKDLVCDFPKVYVQLDLSIFINAGRWDRACKKTGASSPHF